MLPSLDRSEAPLLVATFFPSITAEEVRAHFHEIEAASEGFDRVGVVVDLSDAPLYSRALVQIAATEMNAMYRRAGDRIVAVAHVITSAPARALLSSVQWLAPPPFPTLVTSSHEDGKSWTFAQLNRVSLDGRVPQATLSALAQLLQRADPGLLGYLATRLDEGGRISASPVSEIADVRNETARAVSEHAPPTLAAIGRRLGMSRRTLQRRLHERGVTFGQIVDSVRREAAMAAIKTPARISIQEVARACGFEDLKSFRRAFRKWTGRSPNDYRRRGA